MRSVRSLRNYTNKNVFKPVWLSRYQKHYKNTSTCKGDEQRNQPQSDPYDANFEFTECDQYAKVTVIGAAGRVGRTLSLLLKTCPLIDHLCLFDIDKSIKGIGVDISHIDTKCSVSHVCGMKNIHKALEAPDVVVIAAGVPASPQFYGNKLFDKNAPIVAGISEACARFCPKACIVLITSPINSLLPVIGEVYHIITNKIPHRKLFGLTTLDVVRANTFVAEVVRKDPNNIIVPVIGGSSQETIVPIISQMKPCCKIKRGEMLALTECVKRAEGNLSDCQNCGTRGASSLSTAYAAFRFTSSLVMALKGAENIIECAYVKSDIIPELEYLASPVKLGVRGIEFNYGYPPLSENVTGKYPELNFLLEGEKVRCQGLKGLKKKRKNLLSRQYVSPNAEHMRLFCTSSKKLKESDDYKITGDKYKSYIKEDRKRTLGSGKEWKMIKNENSNEIPNNFIKSAVKDRNIQSLWNYKTDSKNYKGLKSRARQKLRAFNAKKKIKQGPSIVWMMDKTKQEKIGEKLPLNLKREKKMKELKIVNKEEEVFSLVPREDYYNNETTFLIPSKEERDPSIVYRDFILNQLNEIRRENEELKKKILQIGEERELKATLPEPTDNNELEKTKMNAWWVMMITTVEAFSNFFKKLAWKSDSNKLVPVFDKDKEDGCDSDAFETTLDYTDKSKPDDSYGEKYYNFWENLLKDEVQCQEGKCMGK